MELIAKLQDWYESNCDGDWEHQYGIKIDTIDNPGWLIRIDLTDTSLEGLTLDYKLVENGETDWYSYSIKETVFIAAGDPHKLDILIKIFLGLADSGLHPSAD